MKIRVLSEDMAREYKCDVPHLVISIKGPTSKWVEFPLNKKRCAVLRLSFHDLAGSDDSFKKHPELIPDLFTSKHAEQIKDFVMNNLGVDEIIVHCEAGVSRSPAVAAAIASKYGKDDTNYFIDYIPNLRVYHMVLEAFGLPLNISKPKQRKGKGKVTF